MNINSLIKNIYSKIDDIEFDGRLYKKLLVIDHNYPVYCFEHGENPSIFISSGMHCDEYTQIFGHLNFLKSITRNNNKPDFISIPFINPYGLSKYPKRDRSNRRWKSNFEGVLHRTIREYLSQFNFNISIDMHEDSDLHELYIYERRKTRESLAHRIIDELKSKYDISKQTEIYNESCIDGVIYSNNIKECTLESMMFNNSRYSLTTEVGGKSFGRIHCGYDMLKSVFKNSFVS